MVRTFLAVMACGFALTASAAFGQTPAPTPAEARQALAVLQNPDRLARLIQTLQTIAKAAPAPGPAAPPAAQPTPAPAGPGAAPPASALAIAPDSLGAQLLAAISHWTGRLSTAATATVAVLNALPALWRALVQMVQDPAVRTAVADGAWRIVVVLLCAGAAELPCRRILRRPLRTLAAHAPEPEPPRDPGDSLYRLPYALARLVLELLPVAAFAAIGNVMAGVVAGARPATALVALALVNAYAVVRAILCGGRMLASPGQPQLRLLPVDDAAAVGLMSWLRRIAVVTVAGSTLAEIVQVLDLSRRLHEALIRLTALTAAVLLVAMVIRYRRTVAERIRGGDKGGEIAEWRRWLADTWHYLAIAAIAVAWLISIGAISPRLDAFDFLIGTAGVIVGAWLAAIVVLGALARVLPPAAPGLGGRAARYGRVVRRLVTAMIAAVAVVVLLQFWGVDAMAWFAPGALGGHLVSALITVAVAAVVAILVWEVVNAALDRVIDRLRDSEPARAVRLRTLLPIARTTLLATILIVIGATALSEIGVNIAPLLAGAGIVGIAVGFGAQTLVRDIITGMFILVENTIQVGDTITAAGLSGAVEQLSLRTLRLRAGDGSLHVIPFSSVVTITNANRGIGNAAISASVALNQDVDRVIAALTKIGAELRGDADFAPMILGDLAVWGVDTIAPTGITIAGQIPCTVAGRWPVQREFNRRMLQRFAEERIALATPWPDLPVLRRRFVPENEERF